MPEKYEIEIDDRAVLVEIRQYDSAGLEVSISSITVPDRVAEQRNAPVHERGWKCTQCSTQNMLDVPICQACGTPRSGG